MQMNWVSNKFGRSLTTICLSNRPPMTKANKMASFKGKAQTKGKGAPGSTCQKDLACFPVCWLVERGLSVPCPNSWGRGRGGQCHSRKSRWGIPQQVVLASARDLAEKSLGRSSWPPGWQVLLAGLPNYQVQAHLLATRRASKLRGKRLGQGKWLYWKASKLRRWWTIVLKNHLSAHEILSGLFFF